MTLACCTRPKAGVSGDNVAILSWSVGNLKMKIPTIVKIIKKKHFA
jgi:hypothetical protein